jgi:predicted DNA-binding transcriptional regulator AlpA
MKLQDHQLGYPPRGMRLPRACAYLDIGKTKFLELVEQGRLPAPVHVDDMAIWDRLELDAAFDALKIEPKEQQKRLNTVDMVLGQNND